MASILTNASAMTALQTLSVTGKNLATTQNRIATGLKVSEASDNAAYWSIATTMRSDNKANGAVLDQLGLGAGKIDTAYTSITSAASVVDKIKEKLISAKGASAADQDKIRSEITTFQNQLKAAAGGANYAGSNLLRNDSSTNTSMNIVASYDRAADGTVSTGTISVDLTKTRLIDTKTGGTGILNGVLDATFFKANAPAGTPPVTAPLDDATIDGFLKTVETTVSKLSDGAAELGAAKTRVGLQQDFIKSLSDAVDRGVGSLVDADMNKESARLSALQVQQQLGVQALSIANASNQSIQQLFR